MLLEGASILAHLLDEDELQAKLCPYILEMCDDKVHLATPNPSPSPNPNPKPEASAVPPQLATLPQPLAQPKCPAQARNHPQ